MQNRIELPDGVETRTMKAPSRKISIRSAEGKGTEIVGYAACFYRPSVQGTEFRIGPGTVERIDRHAFDNALKRPDDARCLAGHDSSLILGRVSAGTLKLSVDSIGLAFRCVLPKSPNGENIAESIRRGDIRECSFGFKVDGAAGERWESTDNVRVRWLTDLVLLEVSLVTWPAYTSTSASVERERARGLLDADRRLCLQEIISDYDRRQKEEEAKRLREAETEALFDGLRKRVARQREFDALIGR
jgi:HK97 family phage prohead protease